MSILRRSKANQTVPAFLSSFYFCPRNSNNLAGHCLEMNPEFGSLLAGCRGIGVLDSLSVFKPSCSRQRVLTEMYRREWGSIRPDFKMFSPRLNAEQPVGVIVPVSWTGQQTQAFYTGHTVNHIRKCIWQLVRNGSIYSVGGNVSTLSRRYIRLFPVSVGRWTEPFSGFRDPSISTGDATIYHVRLVRISMDRFKQRT